MHSDSVEPGLGRIVQYAAQFNVCTDKTKFFHGHEPKLTKSDAT